MASDKQMIANLRNIIKRQNQVNDNRLAEIKYLKLQLTKIRDKIDYILKNAHWRAKG